MKISMLLAVLFFSNPAFAQDRHFLYLGGGGEPVTSPSTMFDPSLTAVGTYLSNNTWDSEVRFNGGHTQTDAILAQKFATSKSTGPFTVATFTKMLEVT